MRKSVSSGYPNTKRWVEKMRHSCSFFFNDFKVFGYLMKHSVFDRASQTIHNSYGNSK